MKGFYFITDSSLSKNGNIADVKAAVSAGVSAVQYRDKKIEFSQMVKEALILKSFCNRIPFIINDRLDVALAVGSEGLHLGQEDKSIHEARKALGSNKIIGISVTTLNQAIDAQDNGADYLGVGPIFGTTTKKDAHKPCGIKLISLIKEKCRIPIVAIGGITLDNVQEVVGSGADAVCAISATVTQNNVQGKISQFQDFFKSERING